LIAGSGTQALFNEPGTVLPNTILTKGKIEITTSATALADGMFISGISNVIVIGGDLKITDKGGARINLELSNFRSTGGNIVVLSKGEVIGTNFGVTFERCRADGICHRHRRGFPLRTISVDEIVPELRTYTAIRE
jgi:hypothetical protein